MGHGLAIKNLVPSGKPSNWRALGLAAALLFALRLAASVPAVPEYRVGEKAEADVITPIPLVVFDPGRTDRLRKAEAQKVPPVFRFHPAAARQAEEELRRAFSEMRARFQEGLGTRFDHSPPLLTAELAHPLFGEFLKAFQQGNPNFPLDPNLAELWALGDSGDVILEGLLTELRRFTGHYIRSDALPQGEKWVAGSVRLIVTEQTNAAPTLATADAQGHSLSRTNLFSLKKFREEAQPPAPAEDKILLQFVLGFVRPNCLFEEELTRQARQRRTDSLHAVDHYDAGRAVVRKGETISARIGLALDELRVRTAAVRAQATVARERTREAEAEAAQRAAEATRRANHWLAAGLGLAGAICLLVVGLRLKPRRATVLLPQEASMALATRGGGAADEANWRERALVAEARADNAAALLRANLLPRLARWLSNRMVQRLLAQHSEILLCQQQAEHEVAELATRLETLHTPLEERLKAYEKRIAELEAELAAKGEQSLELIKAKIEMTRQKLELERSQEPLDWN